jgi:hypothetical protein
MTTLSNVEEDYGDNDYYISSTLFLTLSKIWAEGS